MKYIQIFIKNHEGGGGAHLQINSFFYIWSINQMSVIHKKFHISMSIIEDVEKWPQKPIKKLKKRNSKSVIRA